MPAFLDQPAGIAVVAGIAALITALAAVGALMIQVITNWHNLSQFFADKAEMSRRRRWSYGTSLVLAGMLWATLLGAYSSSGAGDGPDSVGLALGGLDLNGACRIQTADSEAYAIVNGPIRGPNAAYSWVCVSGGDQSPIDVDRACRDTYGSDAVARPDDYNDAYSWVCYRNP